MMSLWGDDHFDNEGDYRVFYRVRKRNTLWEGLHKVLPYIFYIAGSVCFLVGSVISIVRSL